MAKTISDAVTGREAVMHALSRVQQRRDEEAASYEAAISDHQKLLAALDQAKEKLEAADAALAAIEGQ